MKLFDLTGKVAVVTGGSSGIGLGIARGMGQAGAKIGIASRDQKKAAEAVAQLAKEKIESFAVPCDVCSESDVKSMIQAMDKKFGRIDILVNNAGTNIRKRPEELSLADWHKVLATNLDSAFLASAAAHPIMKRGGGGKVINIGSMLSIFGSPWGPAYAASKGAIVQLTKSQATAWAGGQHSGQLYSARLDRHAADCGGREETRFQACTTESRRARPPAAGAPTKTSTAWPFSWPQPRPISSPAHRWR